MDNTDLNNPLLFHLKQLSERFIAPLDLLPHTDLREKFIDLVLNGEPPNIDADTATSFHALRSILQESRVDKVRVVVFGGGTGLSNVIGGDSRMEGWSRDPFSGLKEVFPQTKSVVCVTDDGGSTGELLKDLPLIALGDMRHVLLSSIQLRLLQQRYNISEQQAREVVDCLSNLFNRRFQADELDHRLLSIICDQYVSPLPHALSQYLVALLQHIFEDKRLHDTLRRPHCLGNLILVAAVYQNIDAELSNENLEDNAKSVNAAFYHGINTLTEMIGAAQRAVLPCTMTPAQLRVCYSNGVQVTGESKSGVALRRYPVDRVFVDFSSAVYTHEQIFEDIARADILIMAPGSLYSSIIPVFQVPGMADAVRKNKHALKMLISNLWVQAGETDKSISDPERKFHISDMIRAYERNIPGGTNGLFHEVLCLSLKDVPASVLQNYAVEGKIPIYLDKNVVQEQGFIPIECGIYSKKALAEIGVIKHDPRILAQAVKTIFAGSTLMHYEQPENKVQNEESTTPPMHTVVAPLPSKKYRELKLHLDKLPITFLPKNRLQKTEGEIRDLITNIIWKHQDIPISHIQFFKGLVFLDKSEWRREQKWDKVYSFFDPKDGTIKIRCDQLGDMRRLEVAFLVALGQSLLNDYVENKEVKPVTISDIVVGKVYHLHLKKSDRMHCFFAADELIRYLGLARMQQSPHSQTHFTRLINSKEGFTPPGLLMGLLYAWYLDNRLATHIEYKMALMQVSDSDLIPEQQKMLARRQAVISFFRDVVFAVH